MNKEFNDKDIVALEIMSELENYTSYVFTLILQNMHKKNVLDFGSGYGDFCKFLSNKNYIVDGYEPNQTAYKMSLNKGFKVFSTYKEITSLYSSVVSINVLEHIEDDINALSQIKSVMEKDAKLILFLPASMKIWSEMDVEANHFRRYSKEELYNKLNYSGFKIESSQYVDFIGWLVLIIFKYLKITPKFNKKLIIFYDKYVFRFFKNFDFLFKRIVGKNLLVVASQNSI